MAEAGAFAVVLECIPTELAARITEQVCRSRPSASAPGPHCDGQVLVTPDLLGLFEGFRPKFVRRYAELGEPIREAAAAYVADVAEGRFPGESRASDSRP